MRIRSMLTGVRSADRTDHLGAVEGNLVNHPVMVKVRDQHERRAVGTLSVGISAADD